MWWEAGETWLNVEHMLKVLLARAADGLASGFGKTSLHLLITFFGEYLIPSKDLKPYKDTFTAYLLPNTVLAI